MMIYRNLIAVDFCKRGMLKRKKVVQIIVNGHRQRRSKVTYRRGGGGVSLSYFRGMNSNTWIRKQNYWATINWIQPNLYKIWKPKRLAKIVHLQTDANANEESAIFFLFFFF